MLGRQPVKAVGWNLGLRLYLLLVAIFLPTFLSYYVYTIRTIEDLHETEVEDVIRLTSSRIEDWTATFNSLDNAAEREPEAQAQILLRMSQEQEAKAKEIQGTAVEPDPEAVDIRKVAKDLEARAQDFLRTARERDAVTREIRRIAAESSGIEGISLFGVNPEGLLSPIATHGLSGGGKPVTEDTDAVTQGRQQRVVLKGERQVQSVSVPLRVKGEVRGVLHLEVVPAKIGVGLRIREVKANLMLGAMGLVVAVGLGVAIFFHYSVRTPIRQLTETMEDAAEGNLSALVDIRTGEFGWLASTYNRMMRRLKQSVDENDTLLEQIKTFNLELRGKVEAATAELAAKNTQLEGANERLLNLQRRLTSLEKLATLGEIATIIAHELGTPLNAISGHLQLLLADNVSDPNVLSRLRVIAGKVDRPTGIVRGVLK